MASKPKSGPQDMPPKGGYNPIQTSRVHLRRIVTPWVACGLTIASTVIGTIGFAHEYRLWRRNEIELRSAQNALIPLLWAERDRVMLKQIRKNRDEEATLMQDYPGWEVGTYFGQPIFNWASPEKFIEPITYEYFAHCHQRDAQEKLTRTLYL
ncbi:NADH dehydrogenase [ubiquinone] 1 alpha subcomplex subunit 13 [Chelonus insularis]|uniref:NADH dehydrogenase [ubiquinone] 1 alpha subcomplex subunit 13 n=1 Tax=Chelonus insularis TaxID=460826 RepID=UPI00158D6000|nr:NADH dehydrogenase [ubiquinone] 1 alpha subcomplex subunit 13 [Chelonus insularis]